MSRRTWRLCLWLSLTLALLVIGAVLVRNSVAVPATTWMHMYTPGDFPTTRDLVTFLRELRVPIPPAISALEIISVQRTGSTDLVTTHLYRASLVGTYLLALWFSYPSIPRLVASFLASVIFLWATALIHPFNPQICDILLSFFIFLFLTLLRAVHAVPSGRSGTQLVLGFGAGFFLSMAELDRPFVFLLLPFILTGAYLSLRRCPRRVFVALLIPLGLLSGLWHVHLFTAHHQVLSTNYAGFNLYRAWPQAPLGPTVRETHSHPSDDHRWPNVNTEEQYATSQFLLRAVLAYVLANPRDALRHGMRRVLRFAKARTSMYGGTAPPRPVLSVYALAAPASFLFMFGNLLALGWYAIRARIRAPLLLASPQNLLLLITFFSLLALSLGEAKEEARLILSLLPFLAAYPMARPASALGQCG